MTLEYEHREISVVWAVQLSTSEHYTSWATHKNGRIKTYHSKKLAEKAAVKLGGVITEVYVSTKDYREESIAPAENVAACLEKLVSVFKSGLPKATVCQLSSDFHTNVIRHVPLGQQLVLQKGDQDNVVEFKLRYKLDVASWGEALKAGKEMV